MTSETDTCPDAPSPSEVRAEVERMAVSEVFRTSPQLVSFLRFVVEAVLSGKSHRVKGYTIAVEVLRRDAKFDPQVDPIVRVEASRLRRSIERYYGGAGASDPVIIDLPRGSYVPTFRRRGAQNDVTTDEVPPGLAAWMARMGPLSHWLAPLALAVVVMGIAVALIAPPRHEEPAIGTTPAAAGSERATPPLADTKPSGNGMPILSVAAFDVTGTPNARSIQAGSLHDRLSDAFARFDLVNIVGDRPAPAAPAAAMRADFRFGGTIEYESDGAARVRVRLVDAADGNVIWSRVFERVAAGDDHATAEEAIVRQLAPTLLQPFGVVYAYGRGKSMAAGAGDPRYRCILETAESFRSFDPDQHLRARACLERLTGADSSFAIGFSYLAAIYLREYQYGLGVTGGVGSGDLPVLERALRAARRGVELSPESSRAYEILFVILFARRDLPAAFAAGDKAISLNQYDARSRGAYGARLIANGEIDRGMDMLQRVAADGSILPAFEQFFLFLGSYLRNDPARAAFHAGQITSESFQLGLIARALVALANGDRGAARYDCDRLFALNPAWRDDLRGSLARFFSADAIVDRLARELGAACMNRS